MDHPKLGVIIPPVASLDQAHDAMRCLSVLKPQVVLAQPNLSPRDILVLMAHGVQEIWSYTEDETDIPNHTVVPLRAWWDGEDSTGGLRDPAWGGLPTRFHLEFPDERFSVWISDEGHLTSSEMLNIQRSEDTKYDQRIVANDRAEWLVVLASMAAASDPDVVFVGVLPTLGEAGAIDDACAFALRLWYVGLTSGD